MTMKRLKKRFDTIRDSTTERGSILSAPVGVEKQGGGRGLKTLPAGVPSPPPLPRPPLQLFARLERECLQCMLVHLGLISLTA